MSHAALRGVIIAALFPDTTIAPHRLPDRRTVASVSAALDLLDAQRQSQSERASKRRVAVTRADLEASRERFVRKHGRERGWVTAASIEFGLDRGTVTKLFLGE